jgi:hypothetical protein
MRLCSTRQSGVRGGSRKEQLATPWELVSLVVEVRLQLKSVTRDELPEECGDERPICTSWGELSCPWIACKTIRAAKASQGTFVRSLKRKESEAATRTDDLMTKGKFPTAGAAGEVRLCKISVGFRSQNRQIVCEERDLSLRPKVPQPREVDRRGESSADRRNFAGGILQHRRPC